jgi:hypothetical protein
MRIRLRFHLTRPFSSKPPIQPALFSAGFTPQPRPWLPILGSLAAHGALVILIPLVADQLARTYYDDVDWSAYRVEPMRLRVPDVLYYAPPSQNSMANVQGGPHPGRAQSRTQQDAPRAATFPKVEVPKGMELPSIKAPEREDLAVLQPDGRSNRAATPAKLPSLAFWARSSAEAQHRRPHDVREPGRAEAAGVPLLSAKPVAAVPNREAELSDVNIAVAPAVSSPSLPASPSATAPVRNSTAPPRNSAVDNFAGQSTNVIVLSAQPIRPGDVVTLPAGSIRLRSQDHGGSNAGQAGPAAPSAGGEQAPSTREGRSEAGSVTSQQASLRAETGGEQQNRNLPATRSGGALAKAPGETASSGGYEAFTRIMHPPSGNFDVVVTQSAIGGDLPGIPTKLSGSPIYTVYLRVGDIQEWVLAYCLPARKESRNSPYEVYVEDAAPLSPPYPIVTTIPQLIVGQFRSVPLLFRGFLTAEGTFRSIEAGESGAEGARLAAVLQEWRFRPARRNNVPTDVQIALIIPATDNLSRPASNSRGF